MKNRFVIRAIYLCGRRYVSCEEIYFWSIPHGGSSYLGGMPIIPDRYFPRLSNGARRMSQGSLLPALWLTVKPRGPLSGPGRHPRGG